MSKKQLTFHLRKNKIDLEHELLMKEFELALVGEAGFPITILTLILNLKLYEVPRIMSLLVLILAVGIILFDEYRSSKKEAIKSKQEEIDELLRGLSG